jgi:hypothetical protein
MPVSLLTAELGILCSADLVAADREQAIKIAVVSPPTLVLVIHE